MRQRNYFATNEEPKYTPIQQVAIDVTLCVSIAGMTTPRSDDAAHQHFEKTLKEVAEIIQSYVDQAAGRTDVTVAELENKLFNTGVRS